MLNWLVVLAALALSASSIPLAEVQQGTASAILEIRGDRVDLSKSVALLRADAEGLTGQKRLIRVLLSDRGVGSSALVGVAFPPALNLARQGQLRGMLLEFDPLDRTRMRVTLLDKPESGQVSLTSVSLAASQGIWQSLKVTADHIEGRFEGEEHGITSFRFSAPLRTDAAVQDLKGVEGHKSAPLQVLLARAEAIRSGDLAKAVDLSSADSAAQLRSLSPAAMKQVAAGMGELIRELKKSQRVVVREQSATVVLSQGSFASAVRENGSWKAAD